MHQSEKRSSDGDEVRGVSKEDNILNVDNTTPPKQKEHSDYEPDNMTDNKTLQKLEKYILSTIQDISASNMHDIMMGHANSEESITHIINIPKEITPIKQRSRGIPQAFKDEFEKTIKEMKASGMIVDSKSPWCSPVRLVKKSDGSLRVTIDFRKVNNVTEKDAYPLPKINELFTHLAKAKVYSSLDLMAGYHQVLLDEKSRPYTAFATQWGPTSML